MSKEQAIEKIVHNTGLSHKEVETLIMQPLRAAGYRLIPELPLPAELKTSELSQSEPDLYKQFPTKKCKKTIPTTDWLSELKVLSDEEICMTCCDGDGGRCQRYPKIIRGCDWFRKYLSGAEAQLAYNKKTLGIEQANNDTSRQGT